MFRKALLFVAALVALTPALAAAQTYPASAVSNTGTRQGVAPVDICWLVSGSPVCLDDTHALPTTGGGGGGGGGAVTGASASFVDGWNVTGGAQADTACATDNGTCTLQALIKRLNQRLTTLNTTLGTPFQAGGTVAATQSGTWTDIVNGGVASGAADSGNPVKVGCVYNSTPPAPSTGQRVDLQCGSRGSLKIQVVENDNTGVWAVNSTSASDAVSAQSTGNAKVAGYNLIFNGTSWDRIRTIQGADGTGLGIQGVSISPNTSANSAVSITTSSTAVESSRVVCAAACNFYGFQVNTGAVPGWIMLFNATSAPADGAVTPVKWWQVAATTTLPVTLSYGSVPVRMTTGATLVFSTTGPFTKTASATATFSAESK